MANLIYGGPFNRTHRIYIRQILFFILALQVFHLDVSLVIASHLFKLSPYDSDPKPVLPGFLRIATAFTSLASLSLMGLSQWGFNRILGVWTFPTMTTIRFAIVLEDSILHTV